MKILIDAMGGDNAPASAVYGGYLAAQAYGEEVILVGDEKRIQEALAEHHVSEGGHLSIRHAPDVVDMHDDPATILRKKPESSMAVALKMLKAGEGDAVVSAGNTGALLAGATLYGGRIKGIRRAALAPVVPCKTGQVMIVDAGANIECTPEYLVQFGFMGSLYMEKIKGVPNPRVGLINNGTEDTKGDALRRETYQLLRVAGESGLLNFVGNIEGSGVALGACDVAVCDGYSGNVLLKTIEGVARFMGDAIKAVFMRNLWTKLSYLPCKKGLDIFSGQFNQDVIGGAPFLGIAKPVIKAHGSSNEFAIQNAVRQAIDYAQSGMIQAVSDHINHMESQKKQPDQQQAEDTLS